MGQHETRSAMQPVGLHCGGGPAHCTESTAKKNNVQSLGTLQLSIFLFVSIHMSDVQALWADSQGLTVFVSLFTTDIHSSSTTLTLIVPHTAGRHISGFQKIEST